MKLALLWNKIEKEGLALAVVVAAAVWLTLREMKQEEKN